ncbi:MAG: cyclophilin [Candidatus Parabeggiatoa sp. nov. 2]|nr:MAG: cyclophilin [Beggiatoa sp. 4572_84]
MQVKMQTNYGAITIQLNPEKAPKTVDNFLNYVNSGFYNGTLFHRVIEGFMIQGGGMEPGMREKTTNPPIENEATNGLTHAVGTVAMARTEGDSMDVVNKIKKVATTSRAGHQDVPTNDVLIESAEVVQNVSA